MLQQRAIEDTVETKSCDLDEYIDVETRRKPPILEKVGITPTNSYFPLIAVGPKEGKSKVGEGENIADF
jgi:hypothetical protein